MEDVHHPSLKDHKLPFDLSTLKLCLEGTQSLTIQSVPEADLVL